MGKKMMVSFIQFYYFVLDIILLSKINQLYSDFFKNNKFSVGANKVKDKASQIFKEAVEFKNELAEKHGKKNLIKFFRTFKLNQTDTQAPKFKVVKWIYHLRDYNNPKEPIYITFNQVLEPKDNYPRETEINLTTQSQNY